MIKTIDKILHFIDTNKENDETLFVLRGFPVSVLGVEQADAEKMMNNKIMYFLARACGQQKIIAFEEFISLYSFATTQFKKIFILENGFYLNLYPPDIKLSDAVSSALLSHYNEDVGNDINIGNLTEYTDIYSNYIETDTGIGCCHNIQEYLLINEKIERVVFNREEAELPGTSLLSEKQVYSNICTESDYYHLINLLEYSDTSFAVAWESFSSGKEVIRRKLKTLALAYSGRLYEYNVANIKTSRCNHPEIYDILRKYWGYESFRSLSVYDIAEAEKKKKKIVQISQEDIICDLIDQAEHCIQRESFRDIFVTAPTGAGKSLIFQIPAIYLARQYNLLTIVITPLIGLMNDQVQALKTKGYSYAQTINSDISPVIKQEILQSVSDGLCHILYLSPESLLSRSDIEQLIGKRRIGMLIVDEAHIVTTWGKQFRPDYWFLGDHIQKLRRAQACKGDDPAPFLIATFTATAIYEGTEDMYHETLNSLHMVDPITYLGYVRRENISIEVSEVTAKTKKVEYELNKFDSLIEIINLALMRGQKTLIYFPTVVLINSFYSYCFSKGLGSYVTRYNGQMEVDEKNESFQEFKTSEKLIMLATKAFGMGIDIPDIAIVAHFAPTGNVCDYMQEIGRAARKVEINGHAIYKHMSNDFKHINRLHGLSAIRKYQLIEVIKKILELYIQSRYSLNGKPFTKKRNEMLIDAESFAYIFDSPHADENELISKVKTAMLLIQKDYENRGFSPFYMRPIPMFAYGFFSILPREQERINQQYPGTVRLVNHQLNVCEVNLKDIWESDFCRDMSFPKFKYLLYANKTELYFNIQFTMRPALAVEVFIYDDGEKIFQNLYSGLLGLIKQSIYQGNYLVESQMVEELTKSCGVNRYNAENIVSVFLSAVDTYGRDYSVRMNAHMYKVRTTKSETISYQFTDATQVFFKWFRDGYDKVISETNNNKLYIVDEPGVRRCKELMTVLGMLEAMGVLRFKSLGGFNSQIYIYVNETKTMQMVRDRPSSYRNRLLDMINQRHQDSVAMLTFLFQNNFSSEMIWDHLENYFLGILPSQLKKTPVEEKRDESEILIQLQIGEKLKDDYHNWEEVNALFDSEAISDFDEAQIPLADYYGSKLIVNESEIDVLLAWANNKTVVYSGVVNPISLQIAKANGWHCLDIAMVNTDVLHQALEEN